MAKTTLYGGASDASVLVEPEPKPEVEEWQDGEGGLPWEDVPDASVSDVLTWVGDDRDRAKAAWDVETGKATPRSTLVAELEKKLV